MPRSMLQDSFLSRKHDKVTTKNEQMVSQMSEVGIREKDKVFLSGNFQSIASMDPSANNQFN